jgi:type II secretory pathway component PulF
MSLPPIDYQPIGPSQRRIYSVGALVFTLVLSGMLLVGSRVAQHFEPVFRDFHTDLPTLTQWFIVFGRFILDSWGWVILLMIVTIVPFIWAAAVPSPADRAAARRRWRWMIELCVISLFSLALLEAYALIAPMVSLMQAVAPGPKR